MGGMGSKWMLHSARWGVKRHLELVRRKSHGREGTFTLPEDQARIRMLVHAEAAAVVEH
jgi:hypothetical protein